jgi:hypothetical protein
LTWSYTVVLKETRGRTVTFEKMRSAIRAGRAHPDSFLGGDDEQPFAGVLGPHAELRFQLTDRMTGPIGTLLGSPATGFRAGPERHLTLIGKDDQGQGVVAPGE